ncbi:hypothetical protein BJX63DRAFT_438525 [Aspergillus granulosus]|uniref:Uncharacterized protein n=1 Tax=Aspergillus granulosus TaxID=176169 RepID=A0ABR4GRW6_9EURO
MSTKPNKNVTLYTRNDWEVWRAQLEAIARSKSIWEIVTGKQLEASKPVDPEALSMSRPPANSTRSSTTPTGTSEQSQQDRIFNWNVYTHRLKEFKEQQKAIEDTRAWILSTVNPDIQPNNCEPAESIAQWFKNLEKSLGMSTFQLKELATTEYIQAIKPPRTRDIHAWLANWEVAMQKGLRWKIGRVSSCQDWFNDFMNAVNPLYPTWVESYTIARKGEVEKGSLSYREVSDDFHSRLGTAQPRHKVARGSFGPTFAEAEVGDKLEGDESEEEPDTAKTRKRKRGSTHKASDRVMSGPGSRRMSPRNDRAMSGPGSRRMSPPPDRVMSGPGSRRISECKACLRKHDWRRCFYLFPSLASEHFKPKENIVRYTKYILETDQEFADQVKQERARQEAEK